MTLATAAPLYDPPVAGSRTEPAAQSALSLRAIGKLVHLGSRIATGEGRLEDASGKLYAHGTSTCLVLNGS